MTLIVATPLFHGPPALRRYPGLELKVTVLRGPFPAVVGPLAQGGEPPVHEYALIAEPFQRYARTRYIGTGDATAEELELHAFGVSHTEVLYSEPHPVPLTTSE